MSKKEEIGNDNPMERGVKNSSMSVGGGGDASYPILLKRSMAPL